MRIQILSDLHLEFGGQVPPPAPGADAVVLAGDLAPADRGLIAIAADAWAAAGHVVFVPGNHEYYGMDIPAAQRGLAVDCARWGVTLLDPGAATLSGVRFIGATLWTDFLLDGQHREVAAHAAVGGMLNDFRGQIGSADRPGRDFTTWEAAARHRRERAFIEAQLEAAREAGLETVVVTHHAPSPKSVHPRYAGHVLNTGFASDLEEIMLRWQPALWIHGHVHDSVDARVGRTRILANPFGYRRREENPAFRHDLVVEV